MDNNTKKITFIVGAGAIENAWTPVLEVLRESSNIHDLDADGANSILARYVYLMRFYSTGTFPNANALAQGFISEIDKLKEEIANSLTNAEQNKITKARPQLKDILYKFIFSETNECVAITTNWDTVLDNAINSLGQINFGNDINVLHLHGDVKSSKKLYLPSEVVREPYRTKEDDLEMGQLHGTVWRAIEECNISILYGLSLDPLDAELGQTLAAGWSSPNLEEIIIINPTHEKIAKRVKLLIDERYPVKISGYAPDNLNIKVEY